MRLTSPSFADQTQIPDNYTCKGNGVSPSIDIADVPEGTKSLAIILHDPDSVSPDFTHWTIWNIPANQTNIPEASVPTEAIEGKTDYQAIGYGKPCPPSGTGVHRYTFDLYALDIALDLPQGSARTELEAAMQGHIIEQAQLIGLAGS